MWLRLVNGIATIVIDCIRDEIIRESCQCGCNRAMSVIRPFYMECSLIAHVCITHIYFVFIKACHIIIIYHSNLIGLCFCARVPFNLTTFIISDDSLIGMSDNIFHIGKGTLSSKERQHLVALSPSVVASPSVKVLLPLAKKKFIAFCLWEIFWYFFVISVSCMVYLTLHYFSLPSHLLLTFGFEPCTLNLTLLTTNYIFTFYVPPKWWARLFIVLSSTLHLLSICFMHFTVSIIFSFFSHSKHRANL